MTCSGLPRFTIEDVIGWCKNGPHNACGMTVAERLAAGRSSWICWDAWRAREAWKVLGEPASFDALDVLADATAEVLGHEASLRLAIHMLPAGWRGNERGSSLYRRLYDRFCGINAEACVHVRVMLQEDYRG